MLVSAAALARPAGTIDVSALRPGMRGFGLTVMRGTRPERFDVELIDILRNFRPGQDLILIRTPHPRLNTTGSVAGMSGSPVYFDGKLAGAYAYGWPFGVEPVAGVTPIANMLAEIGRPLDPEVWKRLGTRPAVLGSPAAPGDGHARAPRRHARPASARAPGGLPAYLGQERHGALWGIRAHAARSRAPSPSGAHAQVVPASTPVMLGGFDPDVVELLSGELSRVGLVALQAGGGGGGGATGADAGQVAKGLRFEDGGAIGVQLIRGDVSATGIGTVTHVAGQRLVAFGHPMMNAGQTALPTCTARVLHILASERSSFKMAEPVGPLGALVHDRQATIVVDTELRADTVPVTVRMHGVTGAPKTTWHFEVAAQRALTPVLIYAGIVNAVRATAADRTDVMFQAVARIDVEGHGVVELTDEGHTSGGAGSPQALGALRMFSVLDAAQGNPFEVARIKDVQVDLHLRFGDEVAEILDVVAPYREVDPGADVDLQVTLRRFGLPDEVRPVRVHVPRSAAGEKVEVELAAGDEVMLEQPKPRKLDDILDAIREGDRATTLLATVKLPSKGLRLRGHVVHRLPGSALDTLQGVNHSDKAIAFSAYRRSRHPMGQVLSGKAKVQLEVRQEPRR